ncbi:MAG TPA: type III pantothenate kinase [Candidatus Udaeobacter sp.]|jgi:type III pantothenate kinase|nr:type III pantothenate kinase [Candidatus Udaeobacter sp.]
MADAKRSKARSRARAGAGGRPDKKSARRGRPRRLIAVDVGNSDTVVGWFEGRDLSGFWRLTSGRQTTDELVLTLRALLGDRASGDHAGAVLCSVVPALTVPWAEALRRVAGEPAVEVSSTTAPDLPIRYHDRSAVGADRIANAVAARGLYGTPAVVVDLGTATTFDCVSKGGAYLGGVIAPGVGTSAEELFRRAARIPRVELRRPERALGRTTEESLRAGVLWGAAGQVDALVRRIALEMKGTPHVIATGGWAALVAPECETINVVDEGLTLKGMRILWEANR